MSATLLIDLQGQWAYNFPLPKTKETKLGRTPENDIKIPGGTASSRHASVKWEGGRWILRDLGSKNGTLVNGRDVKEYILKADDVIRIGETEIVFRNPEEPKADGTIAAQTIWGATCKSLAKEEKALRGRDPNAAEEPSYINLPEVMVLAQDAPVAAPSPKPFNSAETVNEDRGIMPLPMLTPLPDRMRRENARWVTEQLANILGELASREGESVDSLYGYILNTLLSTIQAENGFIMIANRETRRWEIRAWAGTDKDWNEYERERPVPLTVANMAFTKRKVLCNFLQGMQEAGSSESLLSLKVHAYIAIPITQADARIGVLYFDNRRALITFKERDVMLLERVAEVIARIELQDA